MMEAVRTSETSVDNHFTRQYNPADSSEHLTRRRENLTSQINTLFTFVIGTMLATLIQLNRNNEHKEAASNHQTVGGDKCPLLPLRTATLRTSLSH
jgi:hypothetical protein